MRSSTARRRALAPLALGAAALLAVLTGCATGSPTPTAAPTTPAESDDPFADIDPITLTLGDYQTDTGTFGLMSLSFQEHVTERTNGKVTFENYWAGSLLGSAEQLSGVQSGVADIGLIHGGIFASELPVAAWIQGLGLVNDGSPLHDFVAGTSAILDLVNNWEPFMEEYTSNGVYPLYWTSTVPFMILCTEPVGSGADGYAGRNTRAAGIFQSGATEAIGGVPVTLAYTEIYDSLQRGTIDCFLSPPGTFVPFGFTEVAPEFLPLPVISGITGYGINLDVWNSLPEAVQQVLKEESARAALEYTHFDLEGSALLGAELDSGAVTINDVSGLLPALTEYQQSTLATLADSAPPSVSDPEAAVDYFVERKAHWTKVLVDLGFPLVDASDSAALQDFFLNSAGVDITPFQDAYIAETFGN